LGIVIQSSSAAGKSSLMDAVLAFVPEEDQVKYSAMTGQIHAATHPARLRRAGGENDGADGGRPAATAAQAAAAVLAALAREEEDEP
jgi:hypothetical protein